MAILLPMPCFVAAVLLVRTDTANAAHAGIGELLESKGALLKTPNTTMNSRILQIRIPY